MNGKPFKALGVSGAVFQGLEAFELAFALASVVYESDEVTGLCPITGQPDFYKITIRVAPHQHGLESKSLKLYLQQFREQGAFAETLAGQIAKDVGEALQAHLVTVIVEQKPRGGVSITAQSSWAREGF